MNRLDRSARNLYLTVVISSTAGIIASFLQTLDKLNHLKNPTASLVCNISPVFSCSNVLDAWQSSFFGFPNSLLCLIFFSVTLGVAISAVSVGNLSAKLRYIMHFFAIFFLGFGAWYLWQSIYAIGAICIYCLICYGGVIVMNASWLRINSDKSSFLNKLIKSRWDIALWSIWTFLFILAIYLKFYL